MYASMLNKEMSVIDWNTDAKEIHDFIRGLNPWPVAYTSFGDKTMKIYKSKVLDKNVDVEPGRILKVSKDGMEVACKNNSLLISLVQFPGKKAMEIGEYIKGNKIDETIILGK